jgi:hypothetical protein
MLIGFGLPASGAWATPGERGHLRRAGSHADVIGVHAEPITDIHALSP